MRRSSSRDASDRVAMGLTPATIGKTNVDPKLQEAELGLTGGGKATEVAVQYPYGFAARVQAPSKDENGVERSAETHILTAAGNRSHPIALPPSDRRNPPPVKLEEGETVFYDAKGSYTHFKKDGSRVDRGSGGSTVTHDKDGNVSIVPAKGAKLMMG
jgi:phage gp45-like